MKKSKKIIIVALILIILIVALIVIGIKVYQNVKYFKFTAEIMELRLDNEKILVNISDERPILNGLCYLNLHNAKIINAQNKKISINDLEKGDKVIVTMSHDEPIVTSTTSSIEQIKELKVVDNKE